ncbi:hypothetical protein DRQ53_14230 [bacterium]|nr:MAG: hypothetical protein DRQ53_14230 [bacterium]
MDFEETTITPYLDAGCIGYDDMMCAMQCSLEEQSEALDPLVSMEFRVGIAVASDNESGGMGIQNLSDPS